MAMGMAVIISVLIRRIDGSVESRFKINNLEKLISKIFVYSCATPYGSDLWMRRWSLIFYEVTAKLRWGSRFQFVKAWSQKYVSFLCRVVVFVTLGPVIANSVRKYLAVGIETTFRDRLFHGLRRFQFRSRIFIPETECTIWANSRQSAMDRMECDIVHCVDILVTTLTIHSVALECEIVLCCHRIHILNGYTSFYATQSVTRRHWKNYFVEIWTLLAQKLTVTVNSYPLEFSFYLWK